VSDRNQRPKRTPWGGAGGATLVLAGLAFAGLAACAQAEVAAPAVLLSTDPLPAARADRAQGCGQPPPVAPSSVEVRGRTRKLITVLPASYRPAEPHALVIAFHGRTNSNAEARRYYDLERHAPGPTIFVYPSALQERGGGFGWSEPGDPPGALRDFALFDAVLALMARSYCIDPARVFAVGHSLGASFVNSLGCARGDALRGIATLAGGISRSDCQGAVAALLFHNPKDRLVDFRYGLEARDRFRAQNRLEGDGRSVSLEGFACRRYGDAGAANPVVWCPHSRNRTRSGRYYPHNWPAGTGAAVMAFFSSLPAAATAATAPSPSRMPQG
jgi:polyhydroxybutyrate depolymerase